MPEAARGSWPEIKLFGTTIAVDGGMEPHRNSPPKIESPIPTMVPQDSCQEASDAETEIHVTADVVHLGDSSSLSLDGKKNRGELKRMGNHMGVPGVPVEALPCPRCCSQDTKFCYYNNYNVNQPRYFCKNCQRYWTAGGSTRDVPVGSGKRKKSKPSHASISGPRSDDKTAKLEEEDDRVCGSTNSSAHPNQERTLSSMGSSGNNGIEPSSSASSPSSSAAASSSSSSSSSSFSSSSVESQSSGKSVFKLAAGSGGGVAASLPLQGSRGIALTFPWIPMWNAMSVMALRSPGGIAIGSSSALAQNPITNNAIFAVPTVHFNPFHPSYGLWNVPWSVFNGHPLRPQPACCGGLPWCPTWRVDGGRRPDVTVQDGKKRRSCDADKTA